MDYYDLVGSECDCEPGFEKRLGFKKVFRAGQDFDLIVQGGGRRPGGARFVAVGREMGWLTNMMKAGAAALVAERNDADKKLLSAMGERGTALLFPMGILMETFGLKRTRTMYFMQEMLRNAAKADVRIGFATLAHSRMTMCSYMQLVELAKLIGATEAQARNGVSKVNAGLVEA